MALKKLNGRFLFHITLFFSFLMLSSLVFLGLVALQAEDGLNVVAQIFTATKDSGAMLHEFSQLHTLSVIPTDATPLRRDDTEKIDEMFARYYLSMRYEQIPDEAEMTYRWGIGGPLYLLSLPSVYNDFAGKLEKKISSLPNSVSSVEVQDVNLNGNVFTIIFLIHENLPGNQVRTKRKNAMIEFAYIKSRRRFNPNFTNPFGFTVVRFEETEVKSASN